MQQQPCFDYVEVALTKREASQPVCESLLGNAIVRDA